MAANEQRIFDFYPLEDRILLSGEGVDGLDAGDVDMAVADALLAEAATVTDAAGQVQDPIAAAQSLPNDSDFAETDQLDTDLPLEVVFIDAGVEDPDGLLRDIAQADESSVRRLVFTLDGSRDGVTQISAQLAELSGVDAVHIVSHGDGQGIQLGNTRLDVDSAAGYAGQIANWANALDVDADLLIYGCDLAGTADGRALIDSIGALCDCDVAASDDATGHDSLGGDWDLEYATGSIDTSVAFGWDTQQDWVHVLDSTSLTSTQDAFLQLSNPTTNDGSSASMVIDRESSDLQRALVQFDVSSIGAGATITSATLNLEASSVGGELTIDAYQVLQAWAEGSTTWNDASAGTPWITAGGAFNATALDSMKTSLTGQHSFDVTALVQDWVDGTSQNYGILVGSPDGGGNREAVYDTREGSVVPVLDIVYTPGNSDPVVTLGGGNVTYTENDPPIFIDATATVTDADVTDFDGGILTVSAIAGGSGSDRIAINHEGMAASQVGVTTGPNEVYYGGTLIGTWSGSGAPLAITFNASADATAVQAVTQNITFENLSDDPSIATRTIEFQLTDGDGGTSVAVSKDIDVTAVNDAPVLDNTGLMELSDVLQNSLDPNGDTVAAVIASAGGDRITDVDSGAVEGIAVTAVDDSNGTWQYSTNGGGVWTNFGSVSNAAAVVLTDTVSDVIRFVPAYNYTGNATITFRAWDGSDANPSGTTGVSTITNGGTSAFSTTTETASVYVEPAEILLWMSTSDDIGPAYFQDPSGVPGLDSWSEGTFIGMGDPSLSFGSGTTAGTFRAVTDFDAFAADFDVDITGLHFVTSAITITGPGIATGSIDLLAGDVIFVTQAGETLSTSASGPPAGWANGIITAAGDISVFRAENPDDYSSGFFRLLMNDPSANQTTAITLVESATTVDGTVLAAGDFLFAESGVTSMNDISWYDTSADTAAVLIEGDDIGIESGAVAITGLEFIESATIVGGVALGTGNMLVTTDVADTLGDNNLAVEFQDIFALDVTATTYSSGTAAATAAMLFDGDGNVNFDSNGENLNALSLIIIGSGTNQSPVIGNSGAAVDFIEAGSPSIIDGTITVVDADSADFDGGTLSVSISAGGASGDRLSIWNQGTGVGQVGVSGDDVTYSGTIIGTFSGGLNSGSPLVIVLNANADATSTQALMRNITFWNTSDNPVTAARTVDFTLTDGDGGTSNTISQSATITATADAPIAANDNRGLDFDGIDDYVWVANDPSLVMSDTVTMEAWINPDAFAHTQIIVNKEGEYELGLLSDGSIAWAYKNVDPDWTWHNTGYVIAVDTWTHLAVSYDYGTVSTYVNGTLVDVFYGSGPITDQYIGLDELRIGGRSNNPTNQFFDGEIEEVRVWDTARTQTEIQDNLTTNLAGTETGLVGYWTFEEGSAATANDLTGNNNHGTLTDLPATGTPLWTGYTTDQNTQISIAAADGIISNDVDGDGDTLTVNQVNGSGANVGSMFTLASGANLTVGTLGAFIYDPNGAFDYLAAGQTATDTFTYQVDDGNGGIDTATVTISIVGFNDAPQATNLNAAEVYTEESPLNLTDIVVSDADHASTTVTLTLSDIGAGTLSTGTSGAVTSTFGGGVWTASGAIADVNALLAAVTFNPTGDYASNFTITTYVEDAEPAGSGGVKNFTATPVNDAPVLSSGAVNNLTVLEDSGFTSLGLGTVTYGPGGGADETTQTLTYQVTVLPSPVFGDIFLADGLTKVTTTTYTLTELQGMQFKPADEASGGPSFFSWQVVDDGGTANGGADTLTHSIQLSVTPVNDSPTVAANTGTTVLEGSIGTVITTAMLNEGDPDDAGAELTYTITNVTDNGTMYLALWGALALNDTFTQADIDAGNVTYDHDGSETLSDAFSFSLADGGEDGASPATDTFNFTITPTNDTVTAISDSDIAADAVLENVAVGTSVGVTAFADDVDPGDTVSYSLDNNDGGRFKIDALTGVVTVDGPIDREADGPTRSITVRATSTDTSSVTRVFTIGINDVDEFNVGAVSDTDGAADAVSENASLGTAVGITALATDADATNNTITYSLVDDDGGRFAIDTSTGIVTVAGAIDREADGPSRNITVRASSTDGSSTDQVFAITINDVDEFNVGAVSDINLTGNSVNENAAVSTIVGITASASDADASNNTITYSLFDDDAGRFTIDANSGVVSVAGSIDREADGPTRNITVRASSTDGSSTDQVFTINITDVDEFDVGAITDSDIAIDQVNENAAIGTTVGVVALASDADADDTVTYALDDDDGGRFTINAATGAVTVAGAIDREVDGPTRTITVRANSSDGSSSTRNFNININDVDEFNVGAITDVDVATNAVNENAAVGTVVGLTASATDVDATNNTMTYSLIDDDGGRFAINAGTGVVTVAGAIDRETDGPTRNVTVRASSSDGSFADQVFAIGINDVDEFDVGPITDVDAALNQVSENAGIGSIVGITANAADADATNNIVTYSLDDDAGGRFAVNAGTGVVTVNGPLDFETDASHDVVVQAASADGSTSTQSFTINVLDINEAPVAVDDAYSGAASTPLTLDAPSPLGNDSDVDGDALLINVVAPPSNGTLSVDAFGNLVYTPNLGFVGIETFSYVADDGSLFSNVAEIRIDVAVGAPVDGDDGTPDPDPEPTPEPDPVDSGDDDRTDEDAEESNDADNQSAAAGGVLVDSQAESAEIKAANKAPAANAGESAYQEMAQQQLGELQQYSLLRGSRSIDVSIGQSLQLEMFERLLQLDLEQAIVWQQWNQSNFEEESPLSIFVGSAGVTAGLFSVGYVLWAVRGGAFMAAVSSTLPSWRLVDPASLLGAYRSYRETSSDSVEKLLG